VVVLKARNLNDKHKFRKQDAFAKITLNGMHAVSLGAIVRADLVPRERATDEGRGQRRAASSMG
jgi:hypothetical protein